MTRSIEEMMRRAGYPEWPDDYDAQELLYEEQLMEEAEKYGDQPAPNPKEAGDDF